MKKLFSLILVFLCLCVYNSEGQQSFEKEITGINWTVGDLGAEEHWMPIWLPVLQTAVRFKAGVRLSGGSVAISCPVKVRMEYNALDASGGNRMRFRVKATPQSSSQNTFASGFGFYFPNKIQAGIIGVPGLDNLLPWFDTGIDLWDLLSIVPVAGSPVSSAVSNIGVNMNSTQALPLGNSSEYHDTRTLFSYDLTDLIKTDAKKANAVTRLYNKLSPSAKSKILTAIKVVKRCNDAEALGIFEGILGTAIEKVAGLGSIGIKGDPYFKVEGMKIVMIVKFNVGSRTSGTTVVTLSDPAQFGEFYVSIPPFVTSGEQLTVMIDEISYEFRLSQTLNSQLAVPLLGDIDIVDYTKVITYSRAKKKLTDGECKLSVPLQPSNLPIPEYIVTEGVASAIYTYVSPNIPLKGILEVKKGTQLVKTLSEQNFKTTHGLIVTGLTPSTGYSFNLTCYDAAGNSYTVPALTKTTKAEIKKRSLNEEQEGQSIKNLSATSGNDQFTVTWNTDRTSSTEIFFSPSAEEYLTTYLSGVKKTDNSVNVGWADAVDLPRKLETSHLITIPDLEPGTKYYYRVSSRFYRNNNSNDQYEFYVDKTGEITTKTFPKIKIKTMDGTRPVASLPVELYKTSGSSYPMLLITGRDGFTPLFTLEPGVSYNARLRNHEGFTDVVSSAINVPASAQNELPAVTLNLNRKPSPGGKVVDKDGNPVQGALVKVSGSTSQVTTDSQGNYNFNNLNFFTDKELIVTKSGYFESRGQGQFNIWGQFSAVPVVLNSNIVNLQIALKTGTSPVPNSTVKLKNSAGTVLTTGTTNSSGIVNLQHTFTSLPPAGVYSVEITAASGSKVMPSVEYIGIVPGSSYSYQFQCVTDVSAPVISDLELRQDGGNIVAGFVSSEPGKYMAEITTPSNQSTTVPWTDFPSGTTAVSNKVIVSNGVSGIYKIRIKVKDAYDNERASDLTELNFFNASSLELKAENITTNSAVLYWSQYPNAGDFGKYVIYKSGGSTATTGTPVTEIRNISSVRYLLTSLTSNTQYYYILKVFNRSGQETGSSKNPARVSFKTISSPPVISNLTVSPEEAGLNEPVRITASINDNDTKIASVIVIIEYGQNKNEILNVRPNAANYQVNTTYTPPSSNEYTAVVTAADESGEVAGQARFMASGILKPLINFDKVPATIVEGSEMEGSIHFSNLNEIRPKKEICTITFGDGNETVNTYSGQEITPDIYFMHIYEKSGEYKIEAVIKCDTDSGQSESSVISAKIVVKEP